MALRARLAAHLHAGWRTRFAPAPTGPLHMGHAVNAVFVWSIAQAFGGRVLVRIEDHDAQRAREAFVRGIHEDLAWLGLSSDNAACGLPALLTQREDLAPYVRAFDALEAMGLSYACRCSRRDVAARAGQAPDAEVRYPGTCRTAAVPPTETPARRVILAPMDVAFDDLRHGAQAQRPSEQCGDLLVRDRLGQWTYQFSVVVDDARQGVDVVIRGDDLLASTGRQVQLAALLGRTTPPLFLHHPLIRHPDGTKLSKSMGDTGLAELRAAGQHPAEVLGRAAWLASLQPTAAPLEAAALGRLWSA